MKIGFELKLSSNRKMGFELKLSSNRKMGFEHKLNSIEKLGLSLSSNLKFGCAFSHGLIHNLLKPGLIQLYPLG